MIDLLTDSGTSAMSAKQWAGIMEGDEAYAGSNSFYRFEDAVKKITHMKFIIPTHQGRAAEKILFSIVGGPGKYFPNNTHFDTTRANIEFSSAEAEDLLNEIGKHPEQRADFKGNMDVEKLEAFAGGFDASKPYEPAPLSPEAAAKAAEKSEAPLRRPLRPGAALLGGLGKKS